MTDAEGTTATTRRTPEHVAGVLRERIYGGVACLSTLLVLVGQVETVTTPWGAVVDLAVATGGLWAASLFADYVSHLAAHGRRMQRGEALHTLRASGQILEASVLPLLLLVLAGIRVLALDTAVRAGIGVAVVELGLFALLAVRRTGLPWWQRALMVAALMVIGTLVVVVKTFAH